MRFAFSGNFADAAQWATMWLKSIGCGVAQKDALDDDDVHAAEAFCRRVRVEQHWSLMNGSTVLVSKNSFGVET